MTFEEVQTAILDIVKTAEICDVYQDVMLAADQQEMIDAGKSLLEWAYNTGALTNDLVAELDQSNLNANFIYFTGSHTVTDPTGPVYILGSAVVTLNLTGSNRCKIIAFKETELNLSLSDQSYADLKVNGSDVTVVLDNDSLLNMETQNFIGGSVTTNDNSVVHVRVLKDTELNLESNNTSYIKLTAFHNSIVNGANNDTSIIDVNLNQQAIYNGPAL